MQRTLPTTHPPPPLSKSLPPLEQELKPALRPDEALLEANRCLACYDAPCTRACPTHIDVPRFIKRIATGNLHGAARTILEANILGASCARVCPTEVLCEGACVLGDVQRPIPIGPLQRHATDFAFRRGLPPLQPGPRRPGTVGIIGAGPAGLSCAAELLRLGHESVLYDAGELPGGLNTYGVAQYKMTPRAALEEVEWLLRSGLQVKSGVRVGRDVSVAELLRRHDVLFLGTGMASVPPLQLAGEELPGVFDALDFIADLKLGREPRGLGRPVAGARVAVIGGGNTAIDVTTQAARAGAAEVWLVYRRGPQEMPAYDHEVELSREHGARMLFCYAPLRILGRERVEGIELQRVQGTLGPDGKTRLQPVPGETRQLAVDAVVRATGQGGAEVLRELPSVRSERGVVLVDPDGRTSDPRVWAGGDCVSGGKEVVNAVQEGKLAARSMAREVLSKIPSSASGPGTEQVN